MVLIRIANEKDVPAIVQFNHGLFQEDAGQRDKTVNLEWAVEHGYLYFAGFILQDGRHCWLAEVDGQAVGYLAGLVRPVSDYRLVKTAELESMFVEPSYRGQGIGTALATHFIQWARENKAHSITVTAYYANEKANNFYRRLGFRPIKLTLFNELEKEKR